MKYEARSSGCGFVIGVLVRMLACAGAAVCCDGACQADESAGAPDHKTTSPAEVCPVAGDPAVTEALKPIRQRQDVPAIIGAIVTSKGIEKCGVAGVRKRGTTIPATLDDKWHLGSDTKAMTATLAGKLVEEGALKWDTKVADVFPDLAPSFDLQMKDVTLLHLLSHRAGLPPNLKWQSVSAKGALQDQRIEAVRKALSAKPESAPGSKYQYSNLGYVIVGAIIEKVTGKPWEEEIAEKVFKPLEMKIVGFGGVGTPGQIDQPWSHRNDGSPMPRNGPAVDNPPVMGPAGRVHCSIQDWAKFVADQLRGARGEPALLKNSTYKSLHTAPYGGNYALGWIVANRPWGGGAVLNHGGSNTMNQANVWVAPQRDFAILVCVNQGGETAFKASDQAVGALIKIHASTNQAR